jgi:hypothetical protein
MRKLKCGQKSGSAISLASPKSETGAEAAVEEAKMRTKIDQRNKSGEALFL